MVQDHKEVYSLPLARLGTHTLFLGHDWLTKHNPLIDWRKGILRFGRCHAQCAYDPLLLERKDLQPLWPEHPEFVDPMEHDQFPYESEDFWAEQYIEEGD